MPPAIFIPHSPLPIPHFLSQTALCSAHRPRPTPRRRSPAGRYPSGRRPPPPGGPAKRGRRRAGRRTVLIRRGASTTASPIVILQSSPLLVKHLRETRTNLPPPRQPPRRAEPRRARPGRTAPRRGESRNGILAGAARRTRRRLALRAPPLQRHPARNSPRTPSKAPSPSRKHLRAESASEPKAPRPPTRSGGSPAPQGSGRTRSAPPSAGSPRTAPCDDPEPRRRRRTPPPRKAAVGKPATGNPACRHCKRHPAPAPAPAARGCCLRWRARPHPPRSPPCPGRSRPQASRDGGTVLIGTGPRGSMRDGRAPLDLPARKAPRKEREP